VQIKISWAWGVLLFKEALQKVDATATGAAALSEVQAGLNRSL